MWNRVREIKIGARDQKLSVHYEGVFFSPFAVLRRELKIIESSGKLFRRVV